MTDDSITLAKQREHKNAAETAIKGILNTLEEMTGLVVASVDITRANEIGGLYGTVRYVAIHAELK